MNIADISSGIKAGTGPGRRFAGDGLTSHYNDIFAFHSLMPSPRILIIDDVHPFLTGELKNAGIAFSYQPEISRKEILVNIASYTGLVVRTKTIIDREIIDAGTGLSFIARAGAGMDNVDEAYAAQKGITCFNASGANAGAVGEHALALLLSLFNNIAKSFFEVRNLSWKRDENRGTEIDGKTIGIIGYGYTGTAFAKKLGGFNARILAFDKYRKNFGDQRVAEVSLEQLCSESDVISLHIPLTAETRHMVSREFISNCKKPFWLLNTSRGQIVDTAALAEALESGKVLGAGLDVLENEKPSTFTPEEENIFRRLCSHDHVIITPHIAGWSLESYLGISKNLTLKILAHVFSSQTSKDQRVI